MDTHQKVLFIDAATSYYRIGRYAIGDFFGPVDLGQHLAWKHDSLNFGTGLLAGSIFPGSNRLIFTGRSPCWSGFYVSSMGGAGLVFDNLGVNMVAVTGRAPVPSILRLNRTHGEEIEVDMSPVDLTSAWREGRGGIYSLMDLALKRYGGDFADDPRILAVGPAALATDFGGIASVPISKGVMSPVDTWAGRGGFGSKLLQEHGIAAVVYGGTFLDEDFRQRNVADQWFENRYQKKLAAKDLEATTKYRYDEKFHTGGTFGVNYAGVGGQLLFFNYRSVTMDEATRLKVHKDFIVDHYLKQFNEETIEPKHQKTCGEPCAAVCKKMRDEYKKDYEPYQALGPLAGVFDQRAAEKIAHHADMLGFDAISAGGVVTWLMECLHEGLLTAEETGVEGRPVFSLEGFSLEADSMRNAEIGVGLLDAVVEKRGILDFSEGARKFARRITRGKRRPVLDRFVCTAFGRRGWMVPNQYWTPGALSPMAIMGKYYMHYGKEFLPPREVGRAGAERLKQELIMDNLGVCRFHRGWAEEMLPDIVGSLFGKKEEFLENAALTAVRINARNQSVPWESARTVEFVRAFLERKKEVEGSADPELLRWIDAFAKDPAEAALSYWYEIHRGINESLREF